jgi:hypothetical protein
VWRWHLEFLGVRWVGSVDAFGVIGRLGIGSKKRYVVYRRECVG